MKTLITVLVVLALIALGYYFYSENIPAPSKENTEQTSEYTEPTIVWTFQDGGEKDFIPYTKVFVTVNGILHSVGDFQGSCNEIGEEGGVDGEGLLAGELSAVQCWFAGGGDEIGIFAVEDGSLELMTGVLEEPIEGSAGFRGNFVIRPEFKF